MLVGGGQQLGAVDRLLGDVAAADTADEFWAFHDAADFREAVLRAVNLGDDADTTGAVAGQLAGAHWGESGIPAEWRAGLARVDLIEVWTDGGHLDALIRFFRLRERRLRRT